jgi:hypothetical protein
MFLFHTQYHSRAEFLVRQNGAWLRFRAEFLVRQNGAWLRSGVEFQLRAKTERRYVYDKAINAHPF